MGIRLFPIGAVAVVVVGLGGCSANTRAVTTTTTTSTIPMSTTTTPMATNPTAAGQQLSISVSTQLSSTGQDPSILRPSSCVVDNGTVTAQGTFNGGFVPETYVRFGDVVELYAYDAPSMENHGQQSQVADLGLEKPFAMQGNGPWTVSVPADPAHLTPNQCLVAVQSTHAFMAAGNAGG